MIFKAQGYLARKFFKCVHLSLFMIITLFLKSESLILFKLNKLMVEIRNQPAPGDYEISLKNVICKMFLNIINEVQPLNPLSPL